jgi:formate hydrogenlyase subunit 3/multisubunit Na+/H+ antiporter MnhD subunit
VEASPGDLALGLQSATLLGMGLAFLLAVFPLYAWIPLVAEEASPFVFGFLLWVLPTITIVLGMGFLDHYAWLRSSPSMAGALQGAGILMVVTGGVWAAFQRHLGRMMGYAAVMETGFVVLALGIQPAWSALDVVFLHLIPRGVGLAVWALSLVMISRKTGSLHFRAVQGMIHVYPLACAGIVLAHLSTAGFPLLAGFPPRLALWEGLAGQSMVLPAWLLLGVVGLMIGAIRALAVLSIAPDGQGWAWNETWMEGLLLGVGIAVLFILGVFPQVARPFLQSLPLMFSHLSQ